MKVILAALNAKYVHSNLAVYDLETYARNKWQEEKSLSGQDSRGDISKDSDDDPAGIPELIVKEFTINHNLDFILQELYREKADVYAFSCYIWNIYEILTISRELNKVLPEAEIWYGGPEVSYDAVNYLEKNSFIKGIILGEGEVTFYELTKIWVYDYSFSYRKRNTLKQGSGEESTGQEKYNILKKGKYADIAGIVYRTEENEICQTGKRPLMDLDELPFIYGDIGKKNKTKNKQAEVSLDRQKTESALERFKNKILYYETSRGCSFSCSYCLSSIDKSVRFRSFSIVKGELDFFLEHQVPQVKFVDRTFNCKKEHALEIWNYLLEHDNGVTNFHFEIAADLIGEEELEVFRKMRPGLIQLEIGLQSTNPDTIKEIRRVMDVHKVKETLLKIRSFGNIHQHLDLIAGLPYEDYPSFRKSFEDAYEMKPDQLQLGFLKVLKGSYMGEQAENYVLQYRDVQPYEVLSTKWISYDEILVLKRVEEMVEVYYNSGQFAHVLSYVISFFSSPFDFYKALGDYYKEKELFGIGFKREARYTAFRDFCRFHFGESKDILIDADKPAGNLPGKGAQEDFSLPLFDSLLTFDYYLREKAKTRPAWSKEEPVPKKDYQAFFKNGGNNEISLIKEGHDSKVAARKMHIEPVMKNALVWIEKGHRDGSCNMENLLEKSYCLFDYEERNPLTGDAGVCFFKNI